MNAQQLKQDVKQLIVEGLRLESVRPQDIDDGAPIFVEGLGLDSIDALELVVLVEDKFKVVIPDEDAGKQAFASVNALVEYILTHRGA